MVLDLNISVWLQKHFAIPKKPYCSGSGMEHQKITNINYRRFLDEGRIELLNEEQIVQAISNIKSFYPEEGKALLITLYFTGARPNEVLNIKAKDIKKIKYYLQVKIKGSKKGLPRTVLLPYRNDLVKQLYDYVSKMPNETKY